MATFWSMNAEKAAVWVSVQICLHVKQSGEKDTTEFLIFFGISTINKIIKCRYTSTVLHCRGLEKRLVCVNSSSQVLSRAFSWVWNKTIAEIGEEGETLCIWAALEQNIKLSND